MLSRQPNPVGLAVTAPYKGRSAVGDTCRAWDTKGAAVEETKGNASKRLAVTAGRPGPPALEAGGLGPPTNSPSHDGS